MCLFDRTAIPSLSALILCFLLSSCSDSQSPVRGLNKSQWPEANVDANGRLSLSLPHQPATKRSAVKNAVRLAISPDLKPELHSYGTTFGRVIYLHVELHTLPARSEPPPIPHEVAENVRIYSLPWAPKTVKDPKVRQDLYHAMEYSRRNKRVRYGPDAPIRARFFDLIDPASRNYLPDGEVDGLNRFSSLRCYTSSELQPDPANPEFMGWKWAKRALENKATDDPSPSGCVVNRYNTVLLSKPSEDRGTWIEIVCRPVLLDCVAAFIAAERVVEVDFDNYDIQHWRQIVEPVRKRIEQLVIDANDSM
jgi:hypothetical protein